MKKISFFTILIAVLTAASLLVSGCNQESSQENNPINTTGNVTGIIHVDYIKGYENLGELAGEADLIVVGIVERTEVVLDETTRDREDPRVQQRNTESYFRVEKSIKGDFTDEIIIVQMGAKGWLEEQGNPVFEPGERCFLFLRGSEDSIYGLLHPDGRFRIEDDKVSSMNFVLPTGQARPPLDLTFWRIDLDNFISRVIEAVRSSFVIPDEEPVINMDLQWMMSGFKNVVTMYETGTVIYVKQWGLRHPNPDNPAVRVWKYGEIDTVDMENLLGFLDSVDFKNLEKYYKPLDPSTQSGVSSDLYAVIYARYNDIDKKVITEGYFTPEIDNPYKKLPYPLDEIYTKLITIAEEETEEAYREEI